MSTASCSGDCQHRRSTLTHPHAFKHSRPSSIARPVTHRKSKPPSSCIAPTGIRIISSSVSVPYGSCDARGSQSRNLNEQSEHPYLLVDGPWRICDDDVVLAQDRNVELAQVDVDPLRRERIVRLRFRRFRSAVPLFYS